jgi:hypothetical protein
MKINSLVLALVLCSAFFAGCATGPYPRLAYEQSQFANRLEYLRFCQRYALMTDYCD